MQKDYQRWVCRQCENQCQVDATIAKGTPDKCPFSEWDIKPEWELTDD